MTGSTGTECTGRGSTDTGNTGTGSPQHEHRARALIADFLQRLRRRIAAVARRQAPPRAPEQDRIQDRGQVPASGGPGHYTVYAAHFASRASRLCLAALPGPADDDSVFGLASEALAAGLETPVQDAAELMVIILLRTPHSSDGRPLDDARIAALSRDELRRLLIAQIAQEDAEAVPAALAGGPDAIVADLPDRGVEELATLLGAAAAPPPEGPG